MEISLVSSVDGISCASEMDVFAEPDCIAEGKGHGKKVQRNANIERLRSIGRMAPKAHSAIKECRNEPARPAVVIDPKELLHHAVLESRIDAVSFFILNGSDINHVDEEGKTPLIYAIEKNDEQLTRLLLSFSPSLEVMGSNFGYTALGIAVINNNPKLVEMLVRAGAKVNRIDKHGKTPLQYAVGANNQKLIELLLSVPPKLEWKNLINTGTGKHDNPLCVLIHSNIKLSEKIQNIQILVQEGADVNYSLANKKTALFEAISLGNLKVIELLCKLGADVDTFDSEYKTPIDYAKGLGRKDIVNLLLQYRDQANLDCRLNQAIQSKDKRLTLNLIRSGANINNRRNANNPPLHRVCMEGDPVFAQFLLDNGAKLSEANLPNLLEIIKNQSFSGKRLIGMCEFYLKNGSNPNVFDKDGQSLLCLGVLKGNLPLVQLLLKYSANPNSSFPSQSNRTAVFYAVINNQKPFVRVLLESGANPNMKDSSGNTILDYATSMGAKDMIILLLQYGAEITAKARGGIKDGN